MRFLLLSSCVAITCVTVLSTALHHNVGWTIAARHDFQNGFSIGIIAGRILVVTAILGALMIVPDILG